MDNNQLILINDKSNQVLDRSKKLLNLTKKLIQQNNKIELVISESSKLEHIAYISISNCGKYIAVAFDNSYRDYDYFEQIYKIKIWDLTKTALISEFSYYNFCDNMTFSNDLKYLAFSNHNSVELFNIPYDDRILYSSIRIEGIDKYENIINMMFTKDDKKLICETSNQLHVIDLETEKCYVDNLNRSDFTIQDKYLWCGELDYGCSIGVRSVKTPNNKYTIKVIHENFYVTDPESGDSVTYSDTIKIINNKNQAIERIFGLNYGFTFDDDYIYIVYPNRISKEELLTGKNILSFKDTLKLEDYLSKKYNQAIVFNRVKLLNNNLIVSIVSNKSIIFWDKNNGERILEFIHFLDSDEWLFIGKDNTYNCSSKAFDFFYLKLNGNKISSFTDENYKTKNKSFFLIDYFNNLI